MKALRRRRHPVLLAVDPEARTLGALELREGRWFELGCWSDGDMARVEPFTEVELPVGRR